MLIKIGGFVDTKKQRMALLKEIAQYGERAYRRGAYQAVALKFPFFLVQRLRINCPDTQIFEIEVDDPTLENPTYKLSIHHSKRQSIFSRVRVERTGEEIQKLIKEFADEVYCRKKKDIVE